MNLLTSARAQNDNRPTAPLRSPKRVMRLERLGAAFPTRLSFMRTLIRDLNRAAEAVATLGELDRDRILGALTLAVTVSAGDSLRIGGDFYDVLATGDGALFAVDLQRNGFTLLDDAVEHAHEDDNAEVGIVPRIDQHGFERRVAIAKGELASAKPQEQPVDDLAAQRRPRDRRHAKIGHDRRPLARDMGALERHPEIAPLRH